MTRHTPTYIHPLPFSLPTGEELWLCPNTYSQAATLLGVYRSLDGPPNAETLWKFSLFTRNLIKLYWKYELEDRREAEYIEEWQKNHQKEVDEEKKFMDLVKRIRRADGF